MVSFAFLTGDRKMKDKLLSRDTPTFPLGPSFLLLSLHQNSWAIPWEQGWEKSRGCGYTSTSRDQIQAGSQDRPGHAPKDHYQRGQTCQAGEGRTTYGWFLMLDLSFGFFVAQGSIKIHLCFQDEGESYETCWHLAFLSFSVCNRDNYRFTCRFKN